MNIENTVQNIIDNIPENRSFSYYLPILYTLSRLPVQLGCSMDLSGWNIGSNRDREKESE